MDTKDAFLKIQNVVQSVPLESILATANAIARDTNIPFLPLIITLLEKLVKWRPVANALLGTGMQTANAINAAMSQTANINSEESQESYEQAEIRAMLDQMIDIAAEDGELSPEEERYLIDVAQQVGISEQVVLEKVKMKCLTNKNNQ